MQIGTQRRAQALFQLISHIGIQKEILTDQGTSFMSCTLRECIIGDHINSHQHVQYHSQTDEKVEWFNKTLKSMLRAKLHSLGQMSQENLLQAQERRYNRGTQFAPGDTVLVLLLGLHDMRKRCDVR